MSDSASTSPYQPGIYVKGDDERTAKNAKQAVALVFEGYKLKADDTATDEAQPASGVTETPDEVDPDAVTAESGDDTPDVDTTASAQPRGGLFRS
jgi:hypothetical protein